jgi:multidrug efflux pump subunit AcrA (membrane-fusion protein)
MHRLLSRGRTLLLVALAADVASSCTTGNAAPARDAAARTVAVDRVRRQDLGRHLELAAEFRPYQEIDLHAKVAGYLKAMHVDVGDHVKQGQLIAELEAPEMTQDLAQADAALRHAQVEVERARSELRRSEAQEAIRRVSFDRLSTVIRTRPNLMAQQDIDDANARLQDAQAQSVSARAALGAAEDQVQGAAAAKERLETLLKYLRITAPFAGTITRRLADPGAMIQAGTASHVQAMPVVQLSQVDHLRLVLPVPESAVPRVRLDAPVEVRVESLKRVYQGRISRFTGKLDSATRTMDTEVDLPNPDLVIKAGMFGSATLVLEQRQDVLTIPVQALAGRTLPIKVLVVGKGRTLEERQVEIGLETPDRIEVRSGLQEGDLVVVGARSNLRAGVPVEPKLQTAASETGGM